jgi:hypothetical protein
MHNQRDRWLAGLSNEEFANLCPWKFIDHTESRTQWVAEVRSRLTIRQSDQEILSALYVGLYNTVSKAIGRHACTAPESRGAIIIGSALAYIRTEGLAAIFGELTASAPSGTISIEACMEAQRSHGLEHRYYSNNSEYIESLPVAPQFLADEQAVPDLLIQERHYLCEAIRHHLTAREGQVLRLMVIDTLEADDISQILRVTKRQVWKVQRELRMKLCRLSEIAGVSSKSIDEFQATLKKCPSQSPSI